MLVEAEWSSGDDKEDKQEDLRWRTRNNAKHEALNIIRPDRVSRGARDAVNRRTNAPCTGKRVDSWAWGGEGEVDGCNPSLIANPTHTSQGNNGLMNTVSNHDVVMGNDENKEVQPGVVGAVNAHEFLKSGMKIGGERKVEVPGEHIETRLAKKEDLSALSQEILGQPLTIPIGTLLKLVPPLLRSLGQHTKEGQVGIEKGHKGEGRDHPIKKSELGTAGTKKILLHQGHRSLGQPREGLIVIPV